MSIQCVAVSGADAEDLVAILHDAEEDDKRIRAAVRDPACQAYAALYDGARVGAAVVRWAPQQPSEILYLAIAASDRGKGYGRQLVAALQAELPVHGRTLLVGTANCALDNIAFYQKCGFRMHAVKPDYFAYIQLPLQEHGILLRDMIVFAYDLATQVSTDVHVRPPAKPALFCDLALAERLERERARPRLRRRR